MSRDIFLKISEAEAAKHCQNANVGVSTMEALPEGGVRLVCMSVDGAEIMRSKLKSHLVKGEPIRTRTRPQRPLW